MKPWLWIVVGVSLFACASAPSTPDWVNGKSAKYSDSQYLVGRGQADTQEDARNRARADLAKTLEVGVSAKSSDVTTYSSGPAGGTESQVSRSITTRTEQIVRGIQIPETWQDPTTKSIYALAVLPRSQAAMGLRTDIDRLDAATRGYVAGARSTPDLLAQVASASRALDSQRERDAVQRTLQVIDVTGRGVEPEFNSGQLAADLDALLKRVRMKPQAPSSQELERMLSAALSAAGFVPEAGAAAPYVLFGSLQLDDLGVIDGWYWMRGTLEVQLTEAASGKVRGNKRWEIKTSSPQKATAQRRTLDEADATLKRELRPTILGFAVGN
ncbi:MAG TPA: LPP20 family lipoprotein [Burkholderiales bacterium]|nr:LPP20 family lipoprotein [Burkholderiales bacterium]